MKKKPQTNEYGTPQGGNIGGVVNMFYIWHCLFEG